MSITPDMLSARKSALRDATLPRAAELPRFETKNAKLGVAGSANPNEWVEFQFNPASIVISHTASVAASAGKAQQPGGLPEAQADQAPSSPGDIYANVEEREKARGTTTITLRGLWFDGKNVRRACMLLLSWTHFAPVRGAKSADKCDLPKLKFIWGPQIYLVHLNQVTLTYTKFSQSGIPVRASVDLTLHSLPKIPGPTNPSSGGLPERRVHTLTGAECLPSLATRCYGRPADWRKIAAANGIDDPLRVRPGALVYLPSPQELLEG